MLRVMFKRRRTSAAGLVAAFGTVVLVASPLAFQRAATDTVTVEGRTVDALTGAPIPKVGVFVRSFGLGGESIGAAAQVQSDSDGRFRTSVPANSAVLQVSANDPLHFFGRQRPLDYGSRNFDVAAEVRGQLVTLRLWPASTVEGTVHSDGEPVPGASVELLRATETGLGRNWFGSARWRTQSDRQGRFRLEGLQPGEYLLLAKRDGSTMPVYYPGVDAAHLSEIVRVGSGERMNADVRMAPVRSPGTITGRITGEPPSDGMSVELGAVDLDGQVSRTSRVLTTSDVQGRFTFSGLVPGRYRISAWRFPPTGPNRPWVGGTFDTLFSPSQNAVGNLPLLDGEVTWFASAAVDITAERPAVDADLRLRPAPRMRGRAMFEGDGGSAALLKGVPIGVRPADGSDLGKIPVGGFDEGGAFSTVGLPPGNYILGLFYDLGVKDWTLRSIRLGGHDVLGASIEIGDADVAGLELLFTRQPPRELSGTVTTREGKPASDASIIVFPRNPALWNQFLAMPAPRRVVRVPTSITGSFRMPLPPGEYLAYATDAYPDDWMTARYLRSVVALATFADLSKASAKVSLTLR